MSKFWIVNLIDKIFVSVAVFLIVFSWINFYVKDLWVTFAMSLIFSFAIVFLLYYFLGKKQEKQALTKKEVAEMNKCFLAFRLMKKAEQLNLIKKLIMAEYNLDESDVSLTNKKLSFKDLKGNHLIIIAADILKITDNDIINLLNENYDAKYDCFDIYCNEVAVINADILKDKKINFINHKMIYDKLKTHNLCPSTESLNPSATKFRFKDFAKSMFLPNKARAYFLCGLILIFSSIIIPHHFYYIIFGSMLMLFAIICKILPKISK